MRPIAMTIASALGTGFISPGSGTWGTLVGIGMIWALSQIVNVDINYLLIGVLFLITGIGYWAILQLKDDWEHDDSRITIDEVIGMLITMLFIPITTITLLVGFVLFRVFDIWKPLGVRKFDDLNSNWGVIADDALAGVYANIGTRILIAILPWA